MLTTTLEGTILTWNRGAEDLYGYRADEMLGRNVWVLDPFDGTETNAILACTAGGDSVRDWETVRRRRDGGTVEVSLTVTPVHGADGAVVTSSTIARDISRRRSLQRQAHNELHDTLTELPQRTLLTHRLTQALAKAAQRGRPLAVLFVDLDQFRNVNDAAGHHAGDLLLVEVAKRLRRVAGSVDTVARVGADEYVLVCVDADETEARRVAEEAHRGLSAPFELPGQRLYVSASIGIAVAPPLEAAPDALLRKANAAMYAAKAVGRSGTRLFDAALNKRAQLHVTLTNELRDALSGNDLQVHYQPVVELCTGRLIGVEALARWQHPTRGWIPPILFVALAEKSGLASVLDRRVLEHACRDAASLRSSGVLPLDAKLAVNLSARNLGDPTLLAAVRAAAATPGLPLEALEVEITETVFMEDAEAARSVLQTLRRSGIGVALDDFGTGYSSLTYLRQLPATTIKIDRSFIQHITHDPDDLAITTSVVNLARALGMVAVAEGVETVEQLRLLEQMGCHAGQGYLWSKAVPARELAALMPSIGTGLSAGHAGQDRSNGRAPDVAGALPSPRVAASSSAPPPRSSARR